MSATTKIWLPTYRYYYYNVFISEYIDCVIFSSKIIPSTFFWLTHSLFPSVVTAEFNKKKKKWPSVEKYDYTNEYSTRATARVYIIGVRVSRFRGFLFNRRVPVLYAENGDEEAEEVVRYRLIYCVGKFAKFRRHHFKSGIAVYACTYYTYIYVKKITSKTAFFLLLLLPAGIHSGRTGIHMWIELINHTDNILKYRTDTLQLNKRS